MAEDVRTGASSRRPLVAPALAFCGFSGVGKTTLLEALLPQLRADGLAVAVVKSDGHGLSLDRPGKDSHRLFTAGADVVLRGPDELTVRLHRRGEGIERVVAELAREHDLVLVEGAKTSALSKVWLLDECGRQPPAGVSAVRAILPRDDSRLARALELVRSELEACWRRRPLRAGILVGGTGRRIGGGKQNLPYNGRRFAEIVHEAVCGRCQQVVLLGGGEVPPGLSGLPRLPDPPDLAGPMAGMVSATAWVPDSTWLFVACDMPRLEGTAVDWLLAQRRPGRWAVIPRRDGRLEPLFALYEPQAAPLLGQLAANGGAPRPLADHPKVATPQLPAALASQLTNVNTRQQYEALGNGESI